jgi:hypothetical protein
MTPNQEIVNNVFDKRMWNDNKLYNDIEYDLTCYSTAKDALKTRISKNIISRCMKDNPIVSHDVMEQFDLILSMSGKRRHFNHSFEIFLLGLYFMNRTNFKSKLNDVYSNYKLIFDTWTIVSTAHDIGYPLEASGKIVDKMSSLYMELGMHKVSDKLSSINLKHFMETEEYLYRLYSGADLQPMEVYDIDIVLKDALRKSIKVDDTVINKLIKQLKESNNHGFCSALLLVRKLLPKIIQTSPIDRAKYDDMLLAIGAVIIHSFRLDSKEEFKLLCKLDVNCNPIAYLLTILDNIQDWERNSSYAQDFPEYILSGIKCHGNNVNINFIVKHNDKNIDKALEFIKLKSQLNQISNTKFGIKLVIDYESLSKEKKKLSKTGHFSVELSL